MKYKETRDDEEETDKRKGTLKMKCDKEKKNPYDSVLVVLRYLKFYLYPALVTPVNASTTIIRNSANSIGIAY